MRLSRERRLTLGRNEGVFLVVAIDEVGIDVGGVLVVADLRQDHTAVVVAQDVCVPVLALIRLQPGDRKQFQNMHKVMTTSS